jgi:UDP:flavonoid glycosyltransferase YjiC (YdhE family)
VILFPAIKRAGCPWVRIISCSENEIPDPDIPPHLSGCHENDKAGFKTFEDRFLDLVKPTHARFNEFLAKVGHAPYPLGEFFEASPSMNLLLYPKPLAFKRRYPLDPKRFQYLEGCVRDEGKYDVPQFKANNDKPLIYVSYGSLGRRRCGALSAHDRVVRQAAVPLPDECRRLYRRVTGNVPGNVHLESWYPQPAVIPHVDLFIHHGGNNIVQRGFILRQAGIIMPFCWDGLDNAARIHDTGYGDQLPRYVWTTSNSAA